MFNSLFQQTMKFRMRTLLNIRLTLALSTPARNTMYNINKEKQKLMKIWRDLPVRSFLWYGENHNKRVLI